MAQSIRWHTRFAQQAGWTKNLRQYLYQRANLPHAHKILEVGCGTGAVLNELQENPGRFLVGLDIDRAHISLAKRNSPEALYTQADGHFIPYADNTFDITFCHFLLLWVNDPAQVVSEMTRVTRPGGTVIALAEPDYGGRIDYPEELATLGEWQTAALRRQGADPLLGRKLAGIFHRAGLKDTESGVLGGQWTGQPSPEAWKLEWQVLWNDLQENGAPVTDDDDLNRLRQKDWSAHQHGERVLFVPTFWAWGKK